nr:253_t:CDS:2 [Entrophospora candida]
MFDIPSTSTASSSSSSIKKKNANTAVQIKTNRKIETDENVQVLLQILDGTSTIIGSGHIISNITTWCEPQLSQPSSSSNDCVNRQVPDYPYENEGHPKKIPLYPKEPLIQIYELLKCYILQLFNNNSKMVLD